MFERGRMLVGIILDSTWRVEHESLACSVDMFGWQDDDSSIADNFLDDQGRK
jgi:hypothetical protein